MREIAIGKTSDEIVGSAHFQILLDASANRPGCSGKERRLTCAQYIIESRVSRVVFPPEIDKTFVKSLVAKCPPFARLCFRLTYI